MQQQTPEQSPDPGVPGSGQITPESELYTSEEWKILLETPMTVCRAMMAIAPSGALGTSQEVIALRTGLKEALQQASSPLLAHLRQQLQSREKAEALWKEIQRLFQDRQDASSIRQTAIAACQSCVTLLRNAPVQDSQAYKEFVYALARRVAEAAREGGVLGIGGQILSEAEQTLLKDVSCALGIPAA
jgi:hypothetical protein